MLAGEWSVLEENGCCIALALNRFITVTITEAPEITVTSDFPGFSHSNTFTHTALHYASRYLQEKNITLKPFHLELLTQSFYDTGLNKEKFGLGSSAALVVGIVQAILVFHGINDTNTNGSNVIFKIAFLAHMHAQKNLGSGFDIAVATYKTPLFYRPPDHAWLTQTQERTSLVELVEQVWPNLEIKPITLPHSLHVLVGFVGKGSKTTDLIEKVNLFKQAHPHKYQNIYTQIHMLVEKLCNVLQTNDHEKILSLIRHNRLLLQELSHTSGANLETEPLRLLIELAEQHGAAAKFSGAGGGDCGIAVCFDISQADAIRNAWRQAGIITITEKS